MEALHQDTFKNQAPARTPSDYANPATGRASTTGPHLSATPRSELVNPSAYSSSPSIDSLTERLDHIEHRMAYKTVPGESHDARDSVPEHDDISYTPDFYHNKSAAGLFQRDRTPQTLAEAADGPAFPAPKQAAGEAGIWDADPLDVVGAGESGSQSPQTSEHGHNLAAQSSSALKKPAGKTRSSKAEAAPEDPDVFKKVLDRMRAWPEQDRAFSRTVGLFGFLVFLRTPYGRNLGRMGVLGALVCAWPLEAWVLARKAATKLGWETGGLRAWWRRELAKNNGDGGSSDGFVCMDGAPTLQIRGDGMEEEVLNPETFGTSEEGVGAAEMKMGEAKAINKQAKKRAQDAKKNKKASSPADDEEWEGISISEMKDSISTKIRNAADALSEAVKETAEQAKADVQSAEKEAQHAADKSLSAHEKTTQAFETHEVQPAGGASALFGILSEAGGEDGSEAGMGDSFMMDEKKPAKENPAALFGILGKKGEEKKEGQEEKKEEEEKKEKEEGEKKQAGKKNGKKNGKKTKKN